jgi:ATP-dependent helicase HepA
MKLRHRAQAEWGAGDVLAVEDGQLIVRFAGREGEPIRLSAKSADLARYHFAPGERVRSAEGEAVIEAVDGDRYYVSGAWLGEAALSPTRPRSEILAMLRERRFTTPANFALRRSVLTLDDERRADALGAMLAARVRVLPHQLGVVQRVLAAPRPRFILADEVGLGKTIEAGMIFSALRLAGLAPRVLVVVPEHLQVQWLLELRQRFNQSFALGGEGPQCIVSLAQAAAVTGEWDLVICDEAHHLREPAALAAMQALGTRTWGLLLLTATPMQLDPDEYHALLQLLAPTGETAEAFRARLHEQEAISRAVREGNAAALAALFPADGELRALAGEALLHHLAESYSLSAAMVRNRRVRVGGFTERRVEAHRVFKLADVLREIWQREPEAKVLVFCDASDIAPLRTELGQEGIVSVAYDETLSLVDRDRQVARFRDREGPRVLLCTEIGGEGRNFQMAHHLVHYRLPLSPAAIEQRIGRLDRVGQLAPVVSHVFTGGDPAAQEILRIMRDVVGVFTQTVGGLDAVLERTAAELAALTDAEALHAYARELAMRLRDARAMLERAYDPLLDARSFDAAGITALLERAEARADIAGEGTLEERILQLARDLDERLEDAVTEVARRVGIGVDTAEQVEAFQCAFRFGAELAVEALPGIDISEDRTVLGTFWRDTANEDDTLEYFATGHPIVEALFDFVRDGPFGRVAGRRVAGKASGIEFVFQLELPEETELGARVAARQLARVLPSRMLTVAIDTRGAVVAAPRGNDSPLTPSDAAHAFGDFSTFAAAAAARAEAEGQRQLAAMVAQARADLAREAAAVQAHLTTLLARGAVPAVALDESRDDYAAREKALTRLRLALDSACVFVAI